MWHLLFQRDFRIKNVKNQPRLSWIADFTCRGAAKNSMTDSIENSDICFPEILNAPRGETQLKNRKKKAKKSFAWRHLTHKFAAVSKSMT